jgi:hypothetical protein
MIGESGHFSRASAAKTRRAIFDARFAAREFRLIAIEG